MTTFCISGADTHSASTKYEDLVAALYSAWSNKEWVALIHPNEQNSWWTAVGSGNIHKWPPGPGVVIGSGGSTGGRRWCLQPLAHLQASAQVTGQWLFDMGIDPSLVTHLNPLPLHHISGLMPLVRAIIWGGKTIQFSSRFKRFTYENIPSTNRISTLSLVPTQLDRLLATKDGINWLKSFAVIWVGGAALLTLQAEAARREKLRLAPCYGSTETAAMVCAISPDVFLEEKNGLLKPLMDVQLKTSHTNGSIQVSTHRLSPGWIENGDFNSLNTIGGWWSSGDSGILTDSGLLIQGRVDNAINSGGETIFPEQLEARLKKLANTNNIKLTEVLMISQPNIEWGEQLIALVNHSESHSKSILHDLQLLVCNWPPAERPQRWIICPYLTPSSEGKWDRKYWKNWINNYEL
uniref:O-succinylbenzoate--CoA ligase n=1 Tax=Paulinella longichromatophora TaxID=1708747 RepID=A0A2H4ZP65_9EUKA|nr:O-succinylbenzoate--CoA ligase [Paulinella longichromatophora]